MGKATRWLRSLFGAKKSSTGLGSRRQPPENGASSTVGLLYPKSSDANKHAIAVAAATAAVAEAALAAASAAAEVVSLTTGGGSRPCNGGKRPAEVAALKIQSAFRAYLARRALKALKGLVKLQALVRGHIVRKQSADMLRRMQAMARVQARACANRACLSALPYSSSRPCHHPRSSSMSNVKGSYSQEMHRGGPDWLENWMEETSWTHKYDDQTDKILEVDTWKPRVNQSLKSSMTPAKPQKSRFTREVLPLSSLGETEKQVQTAENTPRVRSTSSRPGSSHKRSPFTPTRRGEYAQSLLGDYPSHPNYMASTESYQAKLRSLSAPRQRMSFERSSTTRRPLDYSDIKSETGFRR